MIHPKKSIYVELSRIKMVELFGLDQKSHIKMNNYSMFYLLMSKGEKTCENGSKKT